MPGRPKTMARKVTELEERALVLEADVAELIPDQYLEHADCGAGSLGQAWQNASNATLNSYCALAALGNMLRNKAGIKNCEADDAKDWKPGNVEHREPGNELDTPL